MGTGASTQPWRAEPYEIPAGQPESLASDTSRVSEKPALSPDVAEAHLTSDAGKMPQGRLQTELACSSQPSCSDQHTCLETIQLARKHMSSPDDVESHSKHDAKEMPQRKRACTIRFGAFSASGTLDPGVTHKTRRQGRALPGPEYPWRLNRQLYQADGTTIRFSEYLAKKKLQGAFKPDTILKMEVSEKEDFSHPFTVFVSTIGMIADGIIHGHEAFWPLCCWGATDLKLGQAVSEQADKEAKDILNLHVFVHVNAASDRLIPISETGQGRSPWGVKARGEAGFDSQQAFWSASPISQGTHGWRLLAEATMFAAQGTEDLTGLRNMIKSAAKVYDTVD
eukprot:TRINITY_DN2055_c0_g1_i1.p1 TRINITY_DN2055_c0_g1~~TRINITY_DN2055_c0_g1_i1.p1  ORF type:complete len:351 (+),score=70.56 TRINITY_DN2055_c0_g1_i1:37-1053(+)